MGTFENVSFGRSSVRKMGSSRAKSSASRIFGRLRTLSGGRMVVVGLRTIEILLEN